MKYLLSRKQFESLGVVSELDQIISEVQVNLSGERNEFTLTTILRGQKVQITFVKQEDSEDYKGTSLHSYFQIIDNNPDFPKFLISLGDLKSSTIAHELKHCDRELSRGMLANFSYYLNHVGRDVIENMIYLAKDEESSDLLTLSLYLINKDEYEAYYNEFQRELKEKIDPKMSQAQKMIVIKEFLQEQDIYLLYKDIEDKGGFNLESYFKDNASMKKYLSAFSSKMEQFQEDEMEKYEDWEELAIENYDTPSGVSKLAKKIDHHFSKIVSEGLKKFSRLYTLF